MELNLIGALTMFKTMDMVPNFSELARTFGRDGHTIKKMYEGKGRKRLPSLSLFLSIFSPSLQYFLRVWRSTPVFLDSSEKLGFKPYSLYMANSARAISVWCLFISVLPLS